MQEEPQENGIVIGSLRNPASRARSSFFVRLLIMVKVKNVCNKTGKTAFLHLGTWDQDNPNYCVHMP